MIRTSLALSRIGGLAAVFFAVLGGMALVVATGVIAESGLRSRVAAQRLVHADVMVSARQSLPRKEDLPVALPERAVLPASLITRLTGFPGVAETTGDVSFPAAVVRSSDVPAAEGDPATAGHGWSSLALAGSLRAGRAPRGSGEVALPRGRLGQEVRLVAGGRSGVYRVTALVDAPGLYFPDTAAADLAGRTSGPRANTVDLVALRLDPGADIEAVAAELRTLLGERYEVATGFLLGDAESPGMAAARGLLIVLSGSIGGISLLVVGFVVGGSLSLSINRQRRDLALLRAAGATPRQVRRLIAIQAAVAGAAALPWGSCSATTWPAGSAACSCRQARFPQRCPWCTARSPRRRPRCCWPRWSEARPGPPHCVRRGCRCRRRWPSRAASRESPRRHGPPSACCCCRPRWCCRSFRCWYVRRLR